LQVVGTLAISHLALQIGHVLADDFWVTYDNFAIVESKWSEKELRSEIGKFDRVTALCENLRDSVSILTNAAICSH
jgi:hypothetical protein